MEGEARGPFERGEPFSRRAGSSARHGEQAMGPVWQRQGQFLSGSRPGRDKFRPEVEGEAESRGRRDKFRDGAAGERRRKQRWRDKLAATQVKKNQNKKTQDAARARLYKGGPPRKAAPTETRNKKDAGLKP
jgi:hypothetical protein